MATSNIVGKQHGREWQPPPIDFGSLGSTLASVDLDQESVKGMAVTAVLSSSVSGAVQSYLYAPENESHTQNLRAQREQVVDTFGEGSQQVIDFDEGVMSYVRETAGPDILGLAMGTADLESDGESLQGWVVAAFSSSTASDAVRAYLNAPGNEGKAQAIRAVREILVSQGGEGSQGVLDFDEGVMSAVREKIGPISPVPGPESFGVPPVDPQAVQVDVTAADPQVVHELVPPTVPVPGSSVAVEEARAAVDEAGQKLADAYKQFDRANQALALAGENDADRAALFNQVSVELVKVQAASAEYVAKTKELDRRKAEVEPGPVASAAYAQALSDAAALEAELERTLVSYDRAMQNYALQLAEGSAPQRERSLVAIEQRLNALVELLASKKQLVDDLKRITQPVDAASTGEAIIQAQAELDESRARLQKALERFDRFSQSLALDTESDGVSVHKVNAAQIEIRAALADYVLKSNALDRLTAHVAPGDAARNAASQTASEIAALEADLRSALEGYERVNTALALQPPDEADPLREKELTALEMQIKALGEMIESKKQLLDELHKISEG